MRAKSVLPSATESLKSAGVRFSPALVLDHNDMQPLLSRGTVLFLGERGEFFEPEGLCVLPHPDTGEPTQCVRHFSKAPVRGGGVLLWTTSDIVAYRSEVSIEDWKRLRAYPVIGFTKPLSPDFRNYISARFAGGVA